MPLDFEIETRLSDRRGTIQFVAIKDGKRVTVARYVPGDLDKRHKTALSWQDNPELHNESAADILDIEGALSRAEAEAVGAEDELEDNDKPKQTQADILANFALDSAELFHNRDGEAFARIEVDGHCENWPVHIKGFRRWLALRYYLDFGKAPSSQAMQDALQVIAGRAEFSGDEMETAIRVAGNDDTIFVDLCSADWSVVEITSGGWRIISSDKCPIRFIRRRGMLALPDPVTGDFGDLRSLINLPDDDQWALYSAWMSACLRPRGPYTILVISGEQGSAKSTACKFGRMLIDPNKAMLRRPPRQDQDLLISASNGWLIAYDNISNVPPWLSDALCMLSTGGGYAVRQLYSNDEEQLFDAMRPICINGIEDVASRPDLLDRSIQLTLPQIPDSRRLEEADLYQRFAVAQPGIFGGLLDVVAGTISKIADVHLDSKPRMADFARISVAAELAMGWPSGRFMAAYMESRSAARSLAIESSIVGPVLLTFMSSRSGWTGSARDMLGDLASFDGEACKRKDWPGDPRKLRGELQRLAPVLRASGVDIEFTDQKSKTGRVLHVHRLDPDPTSPKSPTSPNRTDGPENTLFEGDGRVTSKVTQETTSPPKSPGNAPENGTGAVENADSSRSGDVGDESDFEYTPILIEGDAL